MTLRRLICLVRGHRWRVERYGIRRWLVCASGHSDGGECVVDSVKAVPLNAEPIAWSCRRCGRLKP